MKSHDGDPMNPGPPAPATGGETGWGHHPPDRSASRRLTSVHVARSSRVLLLWSLDFPDDYDPLDPATWAIRGRQGLLTPDELASLTRATPADWDAAEELHALDVELQKLHVSLLLGLDPDE